MLTLKRYLVFFCFILITLTISTGCQKEVTGDVPGNPVVITSQINVEGRVLDEAGFPLAGANVKAGLSSATTDKNGTFKIDNASFTTSETFVTVTKSGYFKGSRTFFVRQNSNNFIKIQLLRKSITDRIPASSGGDIEMRSNGGSIHFEPGSFATLNGLTYNGMVSVATQYLDPTNAAISEQMPGDLRGRSVGGSVVGLKSYGMVAVELMGENGQPLQIKVGSVATISMNIPPSQLTSAPASIPLWFFNDSTGLWKEEGSAQKQGDVYVGNVSHFTFWNCDDPFEYVKIKARVVNTTGQPIAGVKVQIRDGEGNTAYDFTDNNGYVDGYVPKNQSLTLQVLNACANPAFTTTVGPFAVDTDLGNIVISQNTTTISGTVVNCTGAPVTDGYVQISWNGAMEFSGIVNGAFSFTFINCQGNTTAQLIAVDNIALKQGSPQTVNLTGATVNAGQLTACGVSSATFFTLSLNGTVISANTPNFYRYGWLDSSYGFDADFTYAAYDSLVERYIYVGFQHPSNHIFQVPYSITATDGLLMGYAGINSPGEMFELIPINSSPLTFTEYGALGQFIAGNFNGRLLRENYDSTGGGGTIDTVNAVLNFRVRHIVNPF